MDFFWAFRQAIGLAAMREAVVEGMAALRAAAREADRRNIVCAKRRALCGCEDNSIRIQKKALEKMGPRESNPRVEDG